MNKENIRIDSPEIEAVEHKPLEQLTIELAELDPKPVTNFTPDNLNEVIDDFLNGKIRNPDTATYSKLDKIDFDVKQNEYKNILEEILNHPDIPTRHMHVYTSYVERNLKINELMRQAVLFRKAASEEGRQNAKSQFMEINKELYGEPDTAVAAAMVAEVLADTNGSTDPAILRIRQEFTNLIPDSLKENKKQIGLKPNEETRQYAARMVKHIYKPLLERADKFIEETNSGSEEAEYEPTQVAELFQSIIDKEFPNSGWKAEVTEANAIYVDAFTKTVNIPKKRKPMNANKLKGLVVHELGVHMLRSIVGEKADLIPLRFGLAGVGDAEEGLATMLESTVTEGSKRTGYQHYLTASLLSSGHNFKDTFEIMWRYKVLDTYINKDGKAEITEDFVEDRKKDTAKFMIRSIRGTNALPWYQMLNYYNGSAKIWEYVHTHKDAPELLFLLFSGKIDPTNSDHVRGIFDALSAVENKS